MTVRVPIEEPGITVPVSVKLATLPAPLSVAFACTITAELFSDAPARATNVPPLTVVGPESVLTPERVSVPEPAFVKPELTVPLITPEKVVVSEVFDVKTTPPRFTLPAPDRAPISMKDRIR